MERAAATGETPITLSAAPLPERLRLTPLEELWSIPVGSDPLTEPLSEQAFLGSTRAALEAAVLDALRRPPCVVSFSGGVDSSVVLAVAAHVARREGLPLPVPITNRFPALQEADEAEWQERVVAHLGIEDWTRLEWDDELDILGPLATQILRRHGVLAPFNSHFHQPLLERAQGGSLLAGIGGDELFEAVSRATAARVLVHRERPRLRDLRSVTFALMPRHIRVAVIARRRPFDRYRWIREPARRRLAHAYAVAECEDPLRSDVALRQWWWPSRMVQCNLASKRLLAADYDVRFGAPFLDPGVLCACSRAGGAVGLGQGSRGRGFEALVGDLLPREVIHRRSKASYNGAFWNRHARAFVERWDGRGVDLASVDPAQLRAQWELGSPDAHSYTQLHRAWMASHI